MQHSLIFQKLILLLQHRYLICCYQRLDENFCVPATTIDIFMRFVTKIESILRGARITPMSSTLHASDWGWPPVATIGNREYHEEAWMAIAALRLDRFLLQRWWWWLRIDLSRRRRRCRPNQDALSLAAATHEMQLSSSTVRPQYSTFYQQQLCSRWFWWFYRAKRRCRRHSSQSPTRNECLCYEFTHFSHVLLPQPGNTLAGATNRIPTSTTAALRLVLTSLEETSFVLASRQRPNTERSRRNHYSRNTPNRPPSSRTDGRW